MNATTLFIVSPLLSPLAGRRGVSIKAAVSTLAAESSRVDSGRKSPSLYEILRVKRTASLTEIKGAFRSLAKVYHPDVSGSDDGEQLDGLDFADIYNAYETLSDPAARAMYDLSLGYSSSRKRPVRFPGGYSLSRRWETDQCW
ncbi:CHAPERONE PROTEIN DNAJ 11 CHLOROPLASTIC-LIKE [Salix koriyanagi]|uniref:CHAPERONE PROTEIN DNAJ 11 CHLOROPLASTIC-LIKE n=1 Tax=Salix koriyanagi TaxID=2511006 RepID=A0A9Q0UPH4_9ROSI|nr:CHAPERONE PROTEIN DNAJ 11 CHLOROPLASTIC-LIKE [Salix koriyanagi]